MISGTIGQDLALSRDDPTSAVLDGSRLAV
jgi:hypothetical protein